MIDFRGTGWWEQNFFGRQPMHELRLTIDSEILKGTGWDCIGPFTLQGKITGGNAAIIKQYIGRHQAHYLGTYDGEGVLAGEWRIGDFSGPWLISLAPAKDSHDDEIKELS